MINKEWNTISFVELLDGRNSIPLNSNELHLWSASIDRDDRLIDKCLESLNDLELKQLSFFKFEKLKNNYIISQGLLRLLLANYLNIAPKKIKIGKHNKGKPYPADYPNLRFNISNSGKQVVYAFSIDSEVGVDIEHIRKLNDLDELINTNFGAPERVYINKTSNNKQYRFFKFWTVKEAYLKAIGLGMRLPPDNLEFSIENGIYKLQTINGVFEQEDWIFENFTPKKEYVGTVVHKNPSANFSLRLIK